MRLRKQERIEHYKGIFLRQKHVASLTDRYGLPARGTFEPLQGGEDNLNVLIRDEHGRPVAVARHYLVTPQDEVAAELEFVAFLARHGFPTPEPMTAEGDMLLCTGHGEPSVAVFPFVEGRHAERWTQAQLWTGGRVLAQLHQLCGEHSYLLGRQKEREQTLVDGVREVASMELADKRAFLDAVEAFLEVDLPRGRELLASLPSGPVHHDMNGGNVFWDDAGGFKALIDFDEAHDAPLITDLVMAFHYLAVDESQKLDRQACELLIAGYEEERALSPSELRSLQFCWDLANIVGAMEFVTGNSGYLKSAFECKSFSKLYLGNRGRIDLFLAGQA